LLDSLQRWLATIVCLNISSRSIIGDELQYLRDGFLIQLLKIVVLKSGGLCKFLRSSRTVAHNVFMGHNDDKIMIIGIKMNQVGEIVEAMNELFSRISDFDNNW
jgi:predicted HAD superfamily hydrolase